MTEAGTAPRRRHELRTPAADAGGPAPDVRFRMLGPLEVTANGNPLVLGGPKRRLVLAHLLIRRNQIVSAELLIDEIWGDEPPDAAKSSLHSYVSHLRKALGPERLVGRPPGYVLHASDEEIDASQFAALVTRARSRLASDPAGAARDLRDALGLWRGEALADLVEELSLQPEVERLSELRLGAQEDLIEAELALGRHADLVPELEGLVARHPLRERLCGQLMRAQYRAGRQAEALAAYHRLRGALDRDLGIDPSPAIEALQHQILTHDPVLNLGGEPLRGYRLVELIGSGPFGHVHRATEPQTEHEVAIKVYGRRVANDGDFVRRFDAEARRIFRLEHPHVVPLHDWWREPDAAYVAMRLMRGGSLADRLLNGRAGSADALAWSEQIGSALTAAHRAGIVHGDIRPANVLFDDHGNAYLADFAIGHDAALGALHDGRAAASRFLAPERKTGGSPSPPADIFAFAVLLTELLQGVDLDSNGTALAAMLQRATSAAPDERPGSAADLVATVKRAILRPPETPPLGGLPSGQARNPYKGLRAFEEADALDFVGREELVAQLVERLKEAGEASRLLAIVGPSGSGKSSVVNAGLVPALRAGALPGSDHWLVAAMTPAHRPFEQLERALLSVAVNAPASLGELLASPEGFGPAVERVLPESAELLLVIDQSEELFTISDESERQRFLDGLARSIKDRSSRVRIVMTLRADFYDRPLRHDQFGRLLARRTHAVAPFAAEQLERIVSEPAERAGLSLEPGLSARIVAEMSDQPGGLPLLQYALTELWERRDGPRLSLAAYEASGGIAGAVGRRAEHLVNQLDADGHESARQLFLRLVEPGEGTADTSRRIRASELQAIVHDTQAVDAVTESFARYRLLLFDRDAETREPTIELAHEALLRAWPRLQQWVDEARDDLRNQRRLAAAAAQWIESGRDASFLLTGSRLEHADQWASYSGVRLARLEREYLVVSVAERERVEAEDRDRRAREEALERRAVARLRALVLALGLGALLAGGISLYALGESQRAAREERIANARELAAASVANLDVDPERSILLALAAIDETRSADDLVLREAQDALHGAVVASRVELTVPDEGGYLSWADHPDLGSIFVSQGVEESGIVNVRDAGTGEVLLSWRAHDIDVNDVALSPDGTRLATAGDDGFLKLWNTATPDQPALWGTDDQAVYGPSFSADGALLAAIWQGEGMLRVIDVGSGEPVLEVPGLDGDPYRTAFSPDAARLAVAFASDANAIIGEVATGEVLNVMEGHEGGLLDVAWSPDGRWLATGSHDATAKIWNADDGTLAFTIFGHSDGVWDVAWSPDTTRLLTGGLDGVAKLWEVTDAGPIEIMALTSQELRGGVGGVAFSADGNDVMTAQFTDVAVKRWDVSYNGNAEWINFQTVPDLAGLAFTPDGGELLASTGGGTITRWAIDGLQNRLVAGHHPDSPVLAVEVSPDGALVASAGFNGAMVWDAPTGELRFGVETDQPTEDATSWTQAISWSPDGAMLATASAEGPVRIVDSSGREASTLPLGEGVGVFGLDFSPDGSLLAVAVKPPAWKRWDPALQRVAIFDWRQRTEVMTIGTSSVGLAFDPSGRRLATSNVEEGYAEIWDVTTGAKLATLTGHSGAVSHVAWDPDPERDRLATASRDGTVRVWNGTTGVTEIVLRGHSGPIWEVAFSPDGSRLASSSVDGTVRVWAVDLDDLIQIAESELTRGLTDPECREFLHLAACPTD